MSEEEKSERLFSQLTAAWYNWAVYEMLYKKNVHCWALTTAYYSMMHTARILMTLTSFWDEDFVRNHTNFLRFLNGLKFKEKREQAIDELSTALGVSPAEIDEIFLRLHKILNAFKMTREMASYEGYIIAHQVRSDIEASSWLYELSRRASIYVNEANTKSGNLVFKYLERNPSSAYHLHHLKQEIKQFHRLLEKENLIPPHEVELMVKRFEGLISSVPEPEDFAHFIDNTTGYHSKNMAYDKLDSALRKVREL